MGNIIIIIIIYPLIRLQKYFRNFNRKNVLVVSAGKIGDFIVISSLISSYKNIEIDIIIDSNSLLPLAERAFFRDIYIKSQIKKNLASKLYYVYSLNKKKYNEVIVTNPDGAYSFFALTCAAAYSATIRSPYHRRITRFFYLFYDRVIPHSSATLFAYKSLPMNSSGCSSAQYSYLLNEDNIYKGLDYLSADDFVVGVAVSSGNQSKTITIDEWEYLSGVLAVFNPVIVLFGVSGFSIADVCELFEGFRVYSTIDLVDLDKLHENLAMCDVLIGSDTGLMYLADSLDIPTLTYMGPCASWEQRPLAENSMIVYPEQYVPPEEVSHIYSTPYSRNWGKFYKTSSNQRLLIHSFISNLFRV